MKHIRPPRKLAPTDGYNNGSDFGMKISRSSHKRHRPSETHYSEEDNGPRLHQWERYSKGNNFIEESTGKRICDGALHNTILPNLSQQKVAFEGQPEVEWSFFISDDKCGPVTNWEADYVKTRDQVMARASYSYNSMLYSLYDHPAPEDEGEPWYPYDPDDNSRRHHALSEYGEDNANGGEDDLEEACKSIEVCFGIVSISVLYNLQTWGKGRCHYGGSS
jgi:hypothetical protein